MNLPNLLSLIRIILTPLFIILLFSDVPNAKFFALLVFAIAAITDAYDGYLARKYNQITPEGKFLDPLADKILVLSAFISFAFIGIIDFWMVGVIIFRDSFITGLRLWSYLLEPIFLRKPRARSLLRLWRVRIWQSRLGLVGAPIGRRDFFILHHQ